MTAEFEEIFGRLSQHERNLADTLGEVSGLTTDSIAGVDSETFQRVARNRPETSQSGRSASSSLGLEQALSRLAESGRVGASGNRTGGESQFFSPEELAKAIQRGANGGLQQNERVRQFEQANEHLKSIDEKLTRLLESGRATFF